jgi:hypothetical protein
MTYTHPVLSSSPASGEPREPQTALPAMLVGGALSLLLWSLLGRLVWTPAG